MTINRHTLTKAAGEQRQLLGCKPQGTEARATMILDSFTRGAFEIAVLAGLIPLKMRVDIVRMRGAGRYLEALELIEAQVRAGARK